jgi:UBX domain-containing protein 7
MDGMQADLLAQFTSITDASVSKAEQYLRITEWNLEQAIQLFFDSDGVDLDPAPSSNATTATAATSAQGAVAPSSRQLGRTSSDAIPIDDDDETEEMMRQLHAENASSFDADAAMAQRMQEELYNESGGAASGLADTGVDSVRAPIARTTETLVGPDDDYIHRMLDPRIRQPRGGIGKSMRLARFMDVLV